MILLAHQWQEVLEDIKVLMRKTMDLSSDVNSSYERVILVFKIQNGWNDVIFQLIHLTGQWYHSLMNWLSSFAITVLGIDAPTPAKKVLNWQEINLSWDKTGHSAVASPK